jgi:hypothetical protein
MIRRAKQRKRLMRFIDREKVARRLTYDVCIPIMRQAMIAFSKGETKNTISPAGKTDRVSVSRHKNDISSVYSAV